MRGEDQNLRLRGHRRMIEGQNIFPDADLDPRMRREDQNFRLRAHRKVKIFLPVTLEACPKLGTGKKDLALRAGSASRARLFFKGALLCLPLTGPGF